jgi:YHS domain-containing protein
MMRFLIVLLVICWGLGLLLRAVLRLVRNVLNSAAPPTRPDVSASQDTALARRLVRDPVCGVHVAEARAIPLRSGAEIVHFCSAACRDKYVASAGKLAANG